MEESAGAPPAEWVHSEPDISDQLQAATLILDEVLEDHPVDRSRIYLVGVSMGGSGAWNWAARHPDRFAAVVPVCGLSEVDKANVLATIPIWTFHGARDETVPVKRTRSMTEAVRSVGGSVQFTEYAAEGHGIAPRVASEAKLYQWLFQQRREVDR